jgi:hypothetical protein
MALFYRKLENNLGLFAEREWQEGIIVQYCSHPGGVEEED